MLGERQRDYHFLCDGVIARALYSHPDLEVSNHIKSTFVGVLLMCSINIIINI